MNENVPLEIFKKYSLLLNCFYQYVDNLGRFHKNGLLTHNDKISMNYIIQNIFIYYKYAFKKIEYEIFLVINYLHI